MESPCIGKSVLSIRMVIIPNLSNFFLLAYSYGILELEMTLEIIYSSFFIVHMRKFL